MSRLGVAIYSMCLKISIAQVLV